MQVTIENYHSALLQVKKKKKKPRTDEGDTAILTVSSYINTFKLELGKKKKHIVI